MDKDFMAWWTRRLSARHSNQTDRKSQRRSGCSIENPTSMAMWSGRRQGWWREISSSVRVLISFETFAPTPAASCFRLLGAIACELGLDLCHFNAEQAFVQSSLEEDVFLRLPPGRGEMSGKIVRLNRSLYGLKQALKSWQNHLINPHEESWI